VRFQTIVLIIGAGALILGAVGAEGQGPGQSIADKLFERAKPDDYMGSEGCADCHSDKAAAFKGSPHAAFMASDKLPLEKQGCEGCHGPGLIHQADDNAEVIAFRGMEPKEASAACLRCHEKTMSPSHWKTSAHARGDLSCVSCHQIHADSEPAWESPAKAGGAKSPRQMLFAARVEPRSMLKADQATLCGQCHGAQVAEFRLNSHHPVPEGRMQCSDCHSAHPTTLAKLRRPDERENCVQCHADLAGPFVYEHDPVAGHMGSGCAECHKAHGSHNPDLLNASSRGLCAQCHSEKLSSHYPGRTCWSAGCHAAPHGSNTDPFLRRK
jgi:predicted CXXCH cytochrome family protein